MRDRWRRVAAIAAASSTYSTLFVLFGARHVGRDPAVDFMEVAMVPLRERGIDRDPGWRSTIAGTASHMAADVLWACVWFGLIQPRLRTDPRRSIPAAAFPWALGTAATEYYVFLPWLQPWLRMQVPFWTAAGVHVSSAVAYPLWLLGSDDPDRRRFGRRAAVFLGVGMAALAGLTWSSRRGRDPRWPGVTTGTYDEEFLRAMTGHHEVGLRLSEDCADLAADPTLRALGRLMTAQHRAELDLMADWWRGWFGGDVPPLSDVERAEMPGMPASEDVDELERLRGTEFDRRFAAIMVPHHLGAIRMARRAVAEAVDPRVKLLALGIEHTQTGQAQVIERGR